MEVSTDIIKYKKWDNQDGPIYSSNKLDVFMIKYQNGTKDVFNVAQSQTNIAANNNTSNDPPLKEAALPVDNTKDVYVGDLKDGKKDGYGKMVYESGAVYEGEWKDDKRNGQGKLLHPKGESSIGEFLNGKLIRGDKVDVPPGYTYTYSGEFENWKLINGTRTTVVLSTGLILIAEYKNGIIVTEKAKKGQNPTASQNGPDNKPTSTQNSKPPGCEDIDFLGAFKISGDGVINDIYVATIRNRAAYTKTVHIEWIDGYGKTKKAAFDVKAGEKIDGRLGLSTPGVRPPTNVRMTSCN